MSPVPFVIDLNLCEHAEFTGAVVNDILPDVYSASDVVAFPSVIAEGGDREGFGLVMVEALGCGCAAVVTDLPAIRDIIRDGKSALVVRQKDGAHLAEKINLLLGDVNLRNSLGRQGRDDVLQRFDWEIITR
jgi:glycosyltransferase involved in cell wall biosynthesis